MPDENGCFAYGEKETEYLKKDKKLAEVIDRVGHVYRKTDPDLFSAVMRHIVGQQISTKAQATVWQRALDKFSAVTPEAIDHASVEDIQSVGISFRKAGYMKDFARKVVPRRVRSGSCRAHERRGSHRSAVVPERYRRLDGGDASSLLPGAAGCPELR